MPTYDYRCERTGELFEQWQSFADDALTKCPQVHDGAKKACGGPVKKVFSKVGIAFKGDGFYKNDHGSSSKPASETGSKESTKEPAKDSPKSDSSSSAGSTTAAAD